MSIWADAFKTISYAFRRDPVSKDKQEIVPAGVLQPDAIPNLRDDETSSAGPALGAFRISSTDFIDLSSVTNRNQRYQEYHRLRNLSEIERALRIFSEEACFAKFTQVQTLYYGNMTIRHLEKYAKDEEFLVYCWDEEKQDYTIGWASNPRKSKVADVIKIKLNNGTYIECTPDHKIMLMNGSWVEAGTLEVGSKLKPFFRVPPCRRLNSLRENQFDRVFTNQDGWTHERILINEWKHGKRIENLERFRKIMRHAEMPSTSRSKLIGINRETDHSTLEKQGFTPREINWLSRTYIKYSEKNSTGLRVVGIKKLPEPVQVYDLTVEKYHNFCSNSVVLHNCQTDDNDNVIQIKTKNKEIKKELEWLFYNRKMLNINANLYSYYKNLFLMGDLFLELVFDLNEPKLGVQKLVMLPAESMYRIETVKGKLIEFQQSKEGPDYQALIRINPLVATDRELQQSNAIRFTPEQIIHIRNGEDRKTFYPYGVSIIEPARGPAHQLRLMEDAMLVYRLSRAPERRVFYIGVSNLPNAKAEALMDRMKDLFKKKKVFSNKAPAGGASAVEERFSAPTIEEDFWVPLRPNDNNTRIETLPGASNLGEIADTTYFKNKLLEALNLPPDPEDPNATRITLSSRDSNFARYIERLQAPMEDGLMQIAERHLELIGYPEEAYLDLKITCTPPSDWREASRAELITSRINNASTLIGSEILSRYDVYIDYFKMSPEEAKEKLSRLNLERMQNLRLQIIGSNPQLLGVGQPGGENVELGSEPGGPNPELSPSEQPQESPDSENLEETPPETGTEQEPEQEQNVKSNIRFGKPNKSDIKKYDLEILNYSQEPDHEDIDYSEN